jgi:hypothetical protein
VHLYLGGADPHRGGTPPAFGWDPRSSVYNSPLTQSPRLPKDVPPSPPLPFYTVFYLPPVELESISPEKPRIVWVPYPPPYNLH